MTNSASCIKSNYMKLAEDIFYCFYTQYCGYHNIKITKELGKVNTFIHYLVKAFNHLLSRIGKVE